MAWSFDINNTPISNSKQKVSQDRGIPFKIPPIGSEIMALPVSWLVCRRCQAWKPREKSEKSKNILLHIWRQLIVPHRMKQVWRSNDNWFLFYKHSNFVIYKDLTVEIFRKINLSQPRILQKFPGLITGKLKMENSLNLQCTSLSVRSTVLTWDFFQIYIHFLEYG